MLFIAIVAVLLVAAIGLIAKYVLQAANRKGIFYESKQITWFEYGIAMAVLTAIVVPSVLLVGKSLSQDQKLRYYEMYNGVEVAAIVEPTECYAGHAGESYGAGQSNCSYTYVSGSYSWEEEYPSTTCTSDSKGSTSCTTTMVCCHYYSANIYSPYATTEYTYSVTNSFGQIYTYQGAYLEKNPKPYGNQPIPGNIPRGAPTDWIEAKQHIDNRDPRSVTDVFEYDNYILASQDEKLAPFSQDVEKYRRQNLLPDHTVNILENPIYGDSRKQARKLSFVHVKVPDEQAWQESLMRFNAALGSKLQGDLHVVIIDSSLVDNPNSYLKALRAYWLGGHFGKHALSKNGIILVIGTSGGKIDWAKADTGMPYGNNMMLRTMEGNLEATGNLTPDAIFGTPRTTLTPAANEGEKAKVTVVLSTPRSALEDAMFGEATKFKRPCMVCEDEEDTGQVGYQDLIAQIEPSTSQRVWMVVIVCVFGLIAWGIVAFTSILERGHVRKVILHRFSSHYGYPY